LIADKPLTVADFRRLLEGLPDDQPVLITNSWDGETIYEPREVYDASGWDLDDPRGLTRFVDITVDVNAPTEVCPCGRTPVGKGDNGWMMCERHGGVAKTD
jgi:hypothetical protein